MEGQPKFELLGEGEAMLACGSINKDTTMEHKSLARSKLVKAAIACVLVCAALALIVKPPKPIEDNIISIKPSAALDEFEWRGGSYDRLARVSLNGAVQAREYADLVNTLPHGNLWNRYIKQVHGDEYAVSPTVKSGKVYQYETCRFAKTKSFPLTLTFKSGLDMEWKVEIWKDSVVQFDVPIPNQLPEESMKKMVWNGDEKDVTSFIPEYSFVEMRFTYWPESYWHSHGIRITMNGQAVHIPRPHSKEAERVKKWMSMSLTTTQENVLRAAIRTAKLR